jgi:hypothetical protein
LLRCDAASAYDDQRDDGRSSARLVPGNRNMPWREAALSRPDFVPAAASASGPKSAA